MQIGAGQGAFCPVSSVFQCHNVNILHKKLTDLDRDDPSRKVKISMLEPRRKRRRLEGEGAASSATSMNSFRVGYQEDGRSSNGSAMPAGAPPPLEKRCLERAAARANPTLVDVCTILPRNTEAEGVRQGWFLDLTTADANVRVWDSQNADCRARCQ